MDEFSASGHPNVCAKHKTTLELTTDDYLTPRGDCIIAIKADKSLKQLPDMLLDKLRKNESRIKLLIECNGVQDEVFAWGSADLILNHPADMVVRKSDFICPRTLAIKANKAAADLKRELVGELRKGLDVKISLKVY
ncbi:MAG: hypothetical protein B6U97_01700 [Candidatus Altiarchaeales archaeon ex4484_96]|nr:MAG: hypothetical protein B6U97_01700 [Candidatus Altiarchaeales archaeon ex4484_96]